MQRLATKPGAVNSLHQAAQLGEGCGLVQDALQQLKMQVGPVPKEWMQRFEETQSQLQQLVNMLQASAPQAAVVEASPPETQPEPPMPPQGAGDGGDDAAMAEAQAMAEAIPESTFKDLLKMGEEDTNKAKRSMVELIMAEGRKSRRSAPYPGAPSF